MKEKNVAIYMAKRLTSASNKNIGERFGITYSAVSRASKSVEVEVEGNKRFRKALDDLNSRFKG